MLSETSGMRVVVVTFTTAGLRRSASAEKLSGTKPRPGIDGQRRGTPRAGRVLGCSGQGRRSRHGERQRETPRERVRYPMHRLYPPRRDGRRVPARSLKKRESLSRPAESGRALSSSFSRAGQPHKGNACRHGEEAERTATLDLHLCDHGQHPLEVARREREDEALDDRDETEAEQQIADQSARTRMLWSCGAGGAAGAEAASGSGERR